VPTALHEAWIGLAVALGCGLLIGVERERRKGRGPDREAAGLRSFAIAAVSGALAQTLPVPGLVVAGALLVGLLAALAYLKQHGDDPGLTTELALFTTYLIGVQTALSPPLGAACGAGLAALLALRERLHRFATTLISEQELHDALLLAALALIALPLIPSRSLPWLGGIDPRPLFAMVLLILGLQAAGHVALRALGPHAGVALGGFLAGFVSSTALVAASGSRARTHPEQTALLAGGAALSGAATWLQALLMVTALSPVAARGLLPVALAGAAGALLGALPLLWRAPHGLAARDREDPERTMLRPRDALAVAALLTGVAWFVTTVKERFGEIGLLAGVALAALADSHAPIVSLASLHAGGTLPLPSVLAGVLVAVAVNTGSRCVVAWIAGGPRYALRVGGALSASLACAVAARLTG
jgi:uncharacterized membrane protein (DUF4010 family)